MNFSLFSLLVWLEILSFFILWKKNKFCFLIFFIFNFVFSLILVSFHLMLSWEFVISLSLRCIIISSSQQFFFKVSTRSYNFPPVLISYIFIFTYFNKIFIFYLTSSKLPENLGTCCLISLCLWMLSCSFYSFPVLFTYSMRRYVVRV